MTNDCAFGPSSLRQTLAEAALIPGADTLTPVPALEGMPLTPANELLATGAAPITVDATNLQGGLTITGGDANRLFRVASGTTLDLKRLTLTHGRTSGAFPDGYGGAIFAQGPLNLTDCTLADCSATTAGGAIAALNGIEVTATRCALVNNSANYGGAVQNEASFIALTSTFAGNRATLVGGAISAPFGHSTLLKHCTLSTNSAGTSGGAYDGTGLLIENTIAAGNTAPTGPNINGAIAGLGPANLLSGSPQLFPQANYGGFSPTMPPLPGSPARNAAASSLISEPIDQRGFARKATPDIGAAEYLGSDFPAPYWLDDWDHDGTANGVELALGTDPTLGDPGSTKNLRMVRQPNGLNVLTFGYNSALAGQARWVLKSSQNLTTWDDVFVWDGSLHFFGDTTGGLSGSTFTIRNARPGTRLFYRFEAETVP